MNLFPVLQQVLRAAGITADLAVFLPAFFLMMARMGAALPFIPFLGGQSVNAQIRMAFSILFAAVLFPFVAGPELGSGRGLSTNLFAGLLAKEVLVGAVIGCFVRIVFSAVEMAAYLIEFQGGLDPQEILAPQTSSSVSFLGQIAGQATIAFCLGAGLHLLFIEAMAQSYVLIPLLQFPTFGGKPLDVAVWVGQISSGFLAIALELSAPVIFMLFLLKAGTALISRISSVQSIDDQLQPLGTFVAFGTLFFGIGVFLDRAWQLAVGILSLVLEFLKRAL